MAESLSSTSATLPLKGWRVLNTRPQAQADKWQQALTAAGADTLRLPLMAIEPVTDAAAIQAIKDCVMAVADYQHAIFVSQNAAQYGLDWLDQYWPQLPYRLKFYAVGSATAKMLLDYGCQVIEPDDTMNSEALLALPDLQNLEHDKVMIFRGVGGRPLLAEQLQARGAEVEYCELYRRVFPREGAEQVLIDQQWGQPRDLLAVHSGESLGNWLELLQSLPYNQQHLKQSPLLVPGERVAALARQHQFETIIVARNASDTAMITAAANWCQTQN